MINNLATDFAWALLLLGCVGVIGSTIFFPLLSAILWQIQKRLWSNSKVSISEDSRTLFFERLIVLIPAHNEKNTLEKTINSIRNVASALSKQGFLGSFTIMVGADHCSDSTAEIATKLGAEVINRDSSNNSALNNSPGKWLTLCSLMQSLPPRIGQNELIALVDAGTCWEVNGSIAAFRQFYTPHTAAISPTYTVEGTNSLFWNIERWLKQIENLSGGPISVHGATAVYRRKALLEAFELLTNCSNIDKDNHRSGKFENIWYNDDVIIPLTIRARQYQPRNIWYSSAWKVIDSKKIKDSPNKINKQTSIFYRLLKSETIDYRRRQRIVWGNIQWIQTKIWRKDFYITLLALRRILRLFWAYWLSSIIVGLSLELASFLHIELMSAFIASVMTIALLANFFGAFLASLSVPILIFLVFRQKYSETQITEKIRWN